jgi:ElaA protein
MQNADKMIWKCFAFHELTNTQLYNILEERARVFVVEQKCAYNDLDGVDIKSYHLVGFYESEIAAYARVIPPHVTYEEMSIGRVITPQQHRIKGFGKLLMAQAIDKCYELFGEGNIKIGAQAYLKKFYESFGFKQVDEPYKEDGVPHIYMLLKQK